MPPSCYDPDRRGFFIIEQPQNWTTSRPTQANPQPSNPSSAVVVHVAARPSPSVLPRPLPGPVEAFEFWDLLFPQAMDIHIAAHSKEPEPIVKAAHGIRKTTDWTGVLAQIEKARNEYAKVDGSLRAGFRKVYRKFNDHAAEPLGCVTKLVPSGGDLGAVVVTPIIGCVQILLEVSIRH